MVITTQGPASTGDPSPLPMARILHPPSPHPASPRGCGRGEPPGSLLPKQRADPQQPGGAALPGASAFLAPCRASWPRPGRAGRSGKAPRARASSRGPRASTRTLTSRQQWLMSRRWTLTLVLIFTRHFTMAARAAAGLARGTGRPRGLRWGSRTAARPPAQLTQAGLVPLAPGSGLFWAPAFPRDRAEVRAKKSSCRQGKSRRGRGGARSLCQLGSFIVGGYLMLLLLLNGTRGRRGERVLTFTGAPAVTLSGGLPGRLPTQKSAPTSALGPLDGKKPLSCSEGPVPLGGQRFCTLSLPAAWAAGPVRLCRGSAGAAARPGAGHGGTVHPPHSLPSPLPQLLPSLPNLCAAPRGPNAHQQHPPQTLLSVTPASPAVRHCCPQRVPQPPPELPALSPAPRGTSRAGPSVFPSATPPSQLHPPCTARPRGCPARGWVPASPPQAGTAVQPGAPWALATGRPGAAPRWVTSSFADQLVPAQGQTPSLRLSVTLCGAGTPPGAGVPLRAGLLCFQPTLGRAERETPARGCRSDFTAGLAHPLPGSELPGQPGAFCCIASLI